MCPGSGNWKVPFFMACFVLMEEGGGRRLVIMHVQGIQATSGSVDLRSPVRSFFSVEAEDVRISEKQRQTRSTNCWISRISGNCC